MKTKLLYAFAAFSMLFSATSCDDFLEEDNKTGETAAITYATKSGIDGLLAGAYDYLRGWYGKEPALGLSDGGTDLFYYGFDNQQKTLMKYTFTSASSSNTKDDPCFDSYWEMGFAAINTCNNVIKYAAACPDLDDATKAQYIAESKFLRALYYFNMVNMWGALPWYDAPITAQSTTPIRTPETEIYGHILQDLDDAIAGGMATTKNSGHATVWSARALRARVLLYAASWICGQLGKSVAANDTYSGMSASALYNAAASEAAAVISGSGASLYDNYEDTWSMSNEDWTKNNEVLFGVAYSSDLKTTVNCIPYKTDGSQFNGLITRTGYSRGGSAMLLMFVSKWNNGCNDLGGNGVKNTQVFYRATSDAHAIASKMTGESVPIARYYSPYGRGFTRYTMSLHLWNLLAKNAATDQRYQGTVLDAYRIADHRLSQNAVNYPKMGEWAEANIADPAELQAFRDTAIYYSVLDGNSAEGQALQAWAKDRYRVQFAYNGDIPLYTSGDESLAEPTEVAKAVSDVYGDKRYNAVTIGGWQSYPGIAKFLDNVYDSNYPTYDISYRDFFVIRLAEMYLIKAEAELMGGSGSALNTVNELRSARAIDGKDNRLTAFAGIDDVLDERAIELCGEFHRWFDLKRTGNLIKYVKAYNHQSAQNIKDYHIYRPIPSTELNAVTNYTEEIGSTTGMWQNPGYSK
jgi:hypothetical protein